jgi:DNA repair protein RecO (recombination protein O)
MHERTTGVILRMRPLTETSLIVHWLTADAGRLSTVARGARRAKSPFRGKLDLFHEADFSFRRSRHSELHTLVEVVLRETFPALRTDWRRLCQAAYGVALIEQTTELDTPMPEIWELFRGFLDHVAGAPPASATILALELRHLEVLGLFPDIANARLSEAAKGLASAMVEVSWEKIPGVAERGELQPLMRFLQQFMLHHLGRVPRGRSEALGLQNSA